MSRPSYIPPKIHRNFSLFNPKQCWPYFPSLRQHLLTVLAHKAPSRGKQRMWPCIKHHLAESSKSRCRWHGKVWRVVDHVHYSLVINRQSLTERFRQKTALKGFDKKRLSAQVKTYLKYGVHTSILELLPFSMKPETWVSTMAKTIDKACREIAVDYIAHLVFTIWSQISHPPNKQVTVWLKSNLKVCNE